MGSILGVDAGGTKILIGRVAGDGRIEGERRYPSKRGTQEAAVEAVMSAVLDYAGRAGEMDGVDAIGLGLVGQVDHRRGIWVHSMGTPIHTPFPICDELSRLTHLPTFADNDVHCATIAEMRLGIGRTCSNFVYLNLGTGTAAGWVSEGRLVRGARNRAGEVGHISCVLPGQPIRCACGRDNCVEWLASGGGMIRQARQRFDQYPDSYLIKLDEENLLHSQTIFECADRGDELASAIAQTVLSATYSMLQDIVNVMDPGAIVLGGGVLNGGWLLPRLIEMLSDWLPGPTRDLLDHIELSTLDPQRVGLLGAACHAMEKYA